MQNALMSKESQLLKSFGRRVRDLRQSKGFSQQSFAEECGLDRTYISGIERGKRNISLENVAALARALDVTISDLLEGID